MEGCYVSKQGATVMTHYFAAAMPFIPFTLLFSLALAMEETCQSIVKLPTTEIAHSLTAELLYN